MNQMERVIDFLVGIGFNAFIILVLLSLKGKLNRPKKRLSILSLITTIIFSVIPTIDKGLGIYYFGFPAEGFVYRGGWNLTTSSLGFVFNFFFFYWLFIIIQKLWKSVNSRERNIYSK